MKPVFTYETIEEEYDYRMRNIMEKFVPLNKMSKKKNKKIEISMYCQNCKLFETCTELKNVSCVKYNPIKK